MIKRNFAYLHIRNDVPLLASKYDIFFYKFFCISTLLPMTIKYVDKHGIYTNSLIRAHAQI